MTAKLRHASGRASWNLDVILMLGLPVLAFTVVFVRVVLL